MSDLSPDPSLEGSPSCLVLHGLGGGPFELEPLIDALGRAGCAMSTPTLPGHKVDRPVMPASTWPEWYLAAEAAFDELAGLGRPVVVVGFSTGGTLALLLAARRPVARLILLAPFLLIRGSGFFPFHPSNLIRPIARFWPDLPRRSSPVRDREARRRLETLNRFRTFSLKATLSAIELIDLIKPIVPKIETPTLILQGKRDSVVDPPGATWLLEHLGSPLKKLRFLERSDHLLALDYDRDEVIAMATSFALGQEI